MLPASKYSILPDSCLACMIKLCPLLALWLQASAAVGSLAPLECPQKKKYNTDPPIHISWFMAGWWGGKANFKQFSLWPVDGSDGALKSLKAPRQDPGKVKVLATTEQFSQVGAGECNFTVNVFVFFFVRSWAPLACGPLLLQDCIDVVHFAQPLEEGNEVQQLSVGHVIEPRGHRHLLTNGHRQQLFF